MLRQLLMTLSKETKLALSKEADLLLLLVKERPLEPELTRILGLENSTAKTEFLKLPEDTVFAKIYAKHAVLLHLLRISTVAAAMLQACL